MMSSMHGARAARRLVVATCALALAHAAPAEAKKKDKYYYEVHDVSLAKGIPDAISTAVAKQLAERIAANPALLAQLEGAPDPEKAPKKFKRYLKRRHLRAFKVNVEVTAYSYKVEPMPAPNRGQYLTVSIDLHAFGETIPDRVMAFTGNGSATVKLEIGRKVRDRDSEAANHDAIEMAIDKALAESITKLRKGPKAKK